MAPQRCIDPQTPLLLLFYLIFYCSSHLFIRVIASQFTSVFSFIRAWLYQWPPVSWVSAFLSVRGLLLRPSCLCVWMSDVVCIHSSVPEVYLSVSNQHHSLVFTVFCLVLCYVRPQRFTPQLLRRLMVLLPCHSLAVAKALAIIRIRSVQESVWSARWSLSRTTRTCHSKHHYVLWMFSVAVCSVFYYCSSCLLVPDVLVCYSKDSSSKICVTWSSAIQHRSF